MTTRTVNGKFAVLEKLLQPGQVLTHPVELITYEVDAAIDRGHPDAAVFVKDTEDVVRVMRWAAENRTPVVARGAGTGLSGGAVAERGGVILEFSKMNRVLEFDRVGRSVVFEAGVVNLRLDEYVKKAGLYFPPDPASGRSATLGGNIAENAGGPHCFKYGVTTNYLTGLEVVLADGRVVHFGGRALDYPEYDLLGLMTGSEGTLGIVTRASARLLRNPPDIKTLMVAFDTVELAGEAVSAIIAAGLVPATMEFMDQKMMRIIEDYAHAGLPVNAGAALIIEVDGFTASLSPQMEEITAILRAHKGWDIRVAQSAEERDKIWYGRKSAAGAMARLSPSYYLLDGTVPRSKLAHALGRVNRICEELELRVAYVFHAGDGNLHPFILIEDPNDAALMQRVFEAGRRIMEVCVELEGSITGEHGVGIEKRRFMPMMFTPRELEAMQQVKQVFDPQSLLNPGKVFPEPARAETPGTAPHPELPGLPDPSTVLSPRSAEEAAGLIASARAAGRPLRVVGGGTKSTLMEDDSTRLSTRELRGIVKYALEDLYVTVRAGTTLKELQAELAPDRMWAPLLSPWEEATIGGIVASNFNAPLRMRYGALRDLVMAATVCLPDGSAIRTGRAVVKNVAGYDLPKLFIGSYGTLGLITDVTLKLAPQPRARASLFAPVQDLHQGLAWGSALLQVCLTASALLLFKSLDEHSTAPYTLVYTAEGVPEDVNAELAQVREVLHQAGAEGLLQVDDPAGSDLWADWMRSAAPQPGTGGAAMPLARLGLPPKDLPRFVTEQGPRLEGAGWLADIANGLLYLKGSFDLQGLRQGSLALGGYTVLLAAPTAADGVDPWGYTPEGVELMSGVKATWDPQGLFNPGAFII